ncbi:MAG: dephospho-CoA kinase [Alistipes sp.]|nr:dephospho-CoA kinase [Alistipes sp.]MDE6857647.1 dephospho-CoA kinase [Alistipes sp.]
MIRVAITGGIGSGKSTVCAMLAERSAAVYDSDSEAKRLMNTSPELRRRIVESFGERAYGSDGRLDRRYMASVVFADASARERLNAIVHPAVMADFDRWCAGHAEDDYTVFESAILFDAGLDGGFDVTVAVVAPLALRLERTCRRDSASPDEVERRIAAQMSDDELVERADYTLVNINRDDLAADVSELDRRFRISKSERDATD